MWQGFRGTALNSFVLLQITILYKVGQIPWKPEHYRMSPRGRIDSIFCFIGVHRGVNINVMPGRF